MARYPEDEGAAAERRKEEGREKDRKRSEGG